MKLSEQIYVNKEVVNKFPIGTRWQIMEDYWYRPLNYREEPVYNYYPTVQLYEDKFEEEKCTK